MDKKSTLYQLMGMRMNGIGSRYRMLTYLLGFSDCRKLLLVPAHPGKEALADGHL